MEGREPVIQCGRPISREEMEGFPALRIMVILDGLFANGPVMELCRKYKWQFMIVLQDKSLPTVHGEFDAISELEPKNRHTRYAATESNISHGQTT
jgi:hypothetical protein